MKNTVSGIAQKLTEFRMEFAPARDGFKTAKQGKKYYTAMIKASQVEVLLSQPSKDNISKIVATCEVWFVTEKDIKTIETMSRAGLTVTRKAIGNLSFGNIGFVANLTTAKTPTFSMLAYFKYLLKRKWLMCDKWCWWNLKRNRMTKIFEVQRPWKKEFVAGLSDSERKKALPQ